MEDQELGTGAAVGDAASTEAGAPTGSEQENRQPEVKRVNLDEFEDFRKYKSSVDQRLSAADRRAQDAERRAKDIEAQFHQVQMQGMDELQRERYEKQLLTNQLAEERRQRELDYFAWQREQDLQKVISKLGVGRDELLQALPQGADSFVMWDVATDLASKRQTEIKRNDPVRQQANQVDLGGGKPSTAADEYQRIYDRAKTDNDGSALIDAWARAAAAGVALKE